MPQQPSNQRPPASAKAGRYPALAISAIALIYAFFAGLRTVGDPDLGWQLATGRWIMLHHQIPHTDVLSYTAAGREWIYPVLSQVTFYLLYQLGGYSLLSWFTAAACVLAVAFLIRSNTTSRILAIFAVPLVAFRIAPRAELFSQLFFVIFVSILFRYHQNKREPLWLLPMLMVLWINTHLGFLAGLGMCAGYVLLEAGELLDAAHRSLTLKRLRSAAPWLIATFLVTLLNPWWTRNYVGMATLLPVQTNRWIAELESIPFTPANLLQAFALRDPRSAFWLLLMIASLAIIVSLVRKKLAPAIILAASIYCVFHATRFQGLFATVVVIIGGAVLGDGFNVLPVSVRERLRGFTHGIKPAALSAALIIVLMAFAGLRIADLVSNRFYLRTPVQFSLFGPGESPWFPENAAAFLKRQHLPANVFHDYNIGGFITWSLWPEYLDYADGRGGPFGDLVLRSIQLSEEPLDSPTWQHEANSRNINTVLLSLDHEFGGGLSSVGTYCRSEQWRPVYLDPNAAIFVRLTPQTADVVRQNQIDCDNVQFRQPHADGSRARAEQFRYYLNAASILVVLGREDEALAATDKAERIFSESANLHYVRGAAFNRLGKTREAENEFRTSLSIDINDDCSIALARLYDDQGRHAEEAAVLSRAAARSPEPHWLYLKLGYAELALGQPAEAMKAFDKAETTSPYGTTEMGTTFRNQITEGRRRAERGF